MKPAVAHEQKRQRSQFRRTNMIFGRYRRLHFVGIGGAGMSGMAEVLADLGYHITGSDNNPGEVTEALQSQGIQVFSGHAAENITDTHLVVISSAVPENNPEVVEAKRRGIPVIKRAEMLGELMRLKFSIGIAGAHGKTTTTALCGHLLKQAGVDPTVIVGGRVTDASIGAKVGSGDYLVAEADEYDRSFLVMYPSIAVATNLEEDHRDIYRDLADLKSAFLEYFNRVPFYGQVVLNADDENLMELAAQVKRPVVTFGKAESADYRMSDIHETHDGVSFTLWKDGSSLGTFSFPMRGEYSAYNALCACAVALELDIAAGTVRDALASFKGALRRFQFIGEVNGRRIYDDYAHHPTEVASALSAAKSFGRPVTVIFQPHLFTRTRDFASEFAKALSVGDSVIVVDIYPAREKPIEGVTSALIVSAAAESGYEHFVYAGEMANAVEIAKRGASDNELIITMGAGNVCRLTEELLKVFG